MKHFLWLFFIPILLWGHQKPPTIKVLINKQVDGAVIEVKGSYKIYDPLSNVQISSGTSEKRAIMESMSDGLRWGERFPGLYQMQIYPNSSDATLLVNGIEYRGTLEVYLIEGQLHIVNEAPIESYIKSALTQKYGTRKFQRATLESIAIISRTMAYHKALNKSHRFFHVDATDGSYMGYAKTLLNLEIDHAVDATSQMVLLYRGKVFPCSWTENCAGKTSSYSSLYRKKSVSPKGVDVPLAKKQRNETSWRLSIPKEQLAEISRVPHVTEVGLYLDKESKKAYALQVKDGRHVSNIEYLKLKKSLGAGLRSSEFTVSLDGGNVIFEGYGDGDGVGLCLYTAELLAKKGDEAPDILADFFPTTHLQKKDSLIDYPKLDLEVPGAKTVNKP